MNWRLIAFTNVVYGACGELYRVRYRNGNGIRDTRDQQHRQRRCWGATLWCFAGDTFRLPHAHHIYRMTTRIVHTHTHNTHVGYSRCCRRLHTPNKRGVLMVRHNAPFINASDTHGRTAFSWRQQRWCLCASCYWWRPDESATCWRGNSLHSCRDKILHSALT